MRVSELMTKKVKTCQVGDSLVTAARLLWEGDCGCSPVVDARGRVLGMITDRDICMAAYTTGRRLEDLQVGEAMGRDVVSIRPADSLREAEMVMRARSVRRLPVLDDQARLIGLLSCNDLLRCVDEGASNGAVHQDAVHLVSTLATVGKPRIGPVDPSTLPQVEAPAPTESLVPPRVPSALSPTAYDRIGSVRLPSRAR